MEHALTKQLLADYIEAGPCNPFSARMNEPSSTTTTASLVCGLSRALCDSLLPWIPPSHLTCLLPRSNEISQGHHLPRSCPQRAALDSQVSLGSSLPSWAQSFFVGHPVIPLHLLLLVIRTQPNKVGQGHLPSLPRLSCMQLPLHSACSAGRVLLLTQGLYFPLCILLLSTSRCKPTPTFSMLFRATTVCSF
jgi:hypothetical protein